MSDFVTQLDALEVHYGVQTPGWPVDPFQFLIWWHCGYPASDIACAKGWKSLRDSVGVTPERLLHARSATVTAALKAGGLIPELRAKRVKLIANSVVHEYGGYLARALRALPPNEVRRALKKLPGMGDPGADRILLFGEIAAVAAVPSNATQVAVRMQIGRPLNAYAKNYLAGQRLIETGVASGFAARQRAFLLLKIHGQVLCKRSRPACTLCPIAESCAFHGLESDGLQHRPRLRNQQRT